MTRDCNDRIEEKLDTVIDLLQRLVALELAQAGAKRDQIARHLHVATAKVVGMLKGVGKGTV